jgi:ribosomal-protein-alanine N-acetyltransferase
MRIRRADRRDLARIVQIESLCFTEEAVFPPEMFVYLIRYSVALVACEPGGLVVGFIMGYTSGSGGAVYTLDVHPLFRRRGVGRELLHALELELQLQGARAIRLEAALEKPEALQLYRQEGFRERELVRNYYGPGKDAVRMWKLLE